MSDDQLLNLDRLKRLSDFWNWLPAYRAVAETQHVRTAAARLCISPSALSRSIGLLEESIGEPLFDREGRGIQLNRAGRDFLDNLRVAMRLIDDALKAVESSTFSGPVHLSAPDDLVGLLWPALRKLREEHPGLTVRFEAVPSSEVADRLHRGALDLAFEQHPKSVSDLEVERFIDTQNAVYCAPDHPLAGREDVTLAKVLEHPFVAGIDSEGNVIDGWSPDTDRRIAACVHRLQAGLEACVSGGLLAALPVHVAEPHCERGLLSRIDAVTLEPSAFYVMRRVSLNGEDRNAVIANALRETSSLSFAHGV